MDKNLKSALAAAEKLKDWFVVTGAALGSDVCEDDWEDLAANINLADEEIFRLEDKLQTTYNKLDNAEQYIDQLELERGELRFKCESLEDEGKIETLHRLFTKYSWNELSEIEKQITI